MDNTVVWSAFAHDRVLTHEFLNLDTRLHSYRLEWLPINAEAPPKFGVSYRKTEREIDCLQGLPSGFDIKYIQYI